MPHARALRSVTTVYSQVGRVRLIVGRMGPLLQHDKLVYIRGPAILIVEDDPRIRQQVGDYLRECGYETCEAEDGDAAVALLQAGGEVACVFSDIQMPSAYDGFALARWLHVHRPSTPVLLTSGFYRSEDLEEDLRATTEVISKPYPGALVAARIAALLARVPPSSLVDR